MDVPYIVAEGATLTVSEWELTAVVNTEVSEMDRCKGDPAAVWVPCELSCSNGSKGIVIPFEIAADAHDAEYAWDEAGYLADLSYVDCADFFGDDWGAVCVTVHEAILSLLRKVEAKLVSLARELESEE